MAHSVKIDFLKDEVHFFGEEDTENSYLSFKPSLVGTTGTAPGSSTFINVQEEYDVQPNSGDVTTKIQAAFDSAAAGSTLYFPPGTYTCSAPITLDRGVSVYAYGATLDWGQTDLGVAPSPGGWESGYALRVGIQNAGSGGTLVRQRITGLTLKRSYTHYLTSPADPSPSYIDAATSLEHTGFRIVAINSCVIEDCMAWGFNRGYEYAGNYDTGGSPGGGDPGDGCSYNNFYHLDVTDCRYGYHISNGNPQDWQTTSGVVGGWCNENSWFGGRFLISSSITDKQNCHAIHIDYDVSSPAASSGSIPNNLRFYGQSLEGSWGRKVFTRGTDNFFYGCRYEVSNAPSPDLEVESVRSGSGNGISFMYGDGLYNAVLQETGSTLYVHKITTPKHFVANYDFSTDVKVGNDLTVTGQTNTTHISALGPRGLLRGNGAVPSPGWTAFNQSSAGYLAFGVADAAGTTSRLAWRAVCGGVPSPAGLNLGLFPEGYVGEQIWRDSSQNQRNALAAFNSAPNYIASWKGMRINAGATTDGDFEVMSASPASPVFSVDVDTDTVTAKKLVAETMYPIINARNYGAKADFDYSLDDPQVDGTDNLTAFTNALAAIPATGGTLLIPAPDPSNGYDIANGAYKLSAELTIARSNVTILLESGAWVHYYNASSAAFNFQGALGSSEVGNADIAANDLLIDTVSLPGAIVPGNLVLFEDDDPPDTGSSVHRELNEVDSTGSSDFTVRYPMSDSFSTTAGSPGEITIYNVSTPIRNCHVTGGGKITAQVDWSSPAAGGGGGVRFQYAMGCSVSGILFRDIDEECVQINDSRDVTVSGCEMSDGARFDGSVGYGVTTTACTGVNVYGNTMRRLRHAVDFSFWSTGCSATGNIIDGCAATALTLHPNVHDITFANNMVSNCQGYDTATDAYGISSSPGWVRATGISVNTNNYNIDILNNTVRNGPIQGISINFGVGTRNIRIEGNQIINCVGDGDGLTGAIEAVESTAVAGTNYEGITIRNNKVIDSGKIGILVGIDNILVENNVVDNAAQFGIWVRPDGGATPVNSPIIRYNEVLNTNGTGIAVGSSSDASGVVLNDPVIEGNYCHDNLNHGIFVYTRYTEGCTIRNNLCCNNNTSGAGSSSIADITAQEDPAASPAPLGGTDHGEYVIDGNFCFGSSRNAIIAGMQKMRITNNTISGITSSGGIGFGIRVEPIDGTDIDNVVVQNNTVEGCGTTGIYLRGVGSASAKDLRVIGNVCNRNNEGIDIDATVSGIVLHDNTLEDNTTADFNDASGTATFIGHLDHANSRYGIGTTTPTTKLHVAGDFKADSTIFGAGNLDIEGVSTFGGHVNPDADAVHNMGSPSMRWKTIYFASQVFRKGPEVQLNAIDIQGSDAGGSPTTIFNVDTANEVVGFGSAPDPGGNYAQVFGPITFSDPVAATDGVNKQWLEGMTWTPGGALDMNGNNIQTTGKGVFGDTGVDATAELKVVDEMRVYNTAETDWGGFTVKSILGTQMPCFLSSATYKQLCFNDGNKFYYLDASGYHEFRSSNQGISLEANTTIRFSINYNQSTYINSSNFVVGVPLVSNVSSATDTFFEGMRWQATNSAAVGGNGLGPYCACNIETSTGAVRTMGLFGWMLTDATDATRTSRCRIQTVKNGSYVDGGHLFMLDGATEAVGMGALPTSGQGKLQVTGKIKTTDEIEIDGAFNHDGTTAGFFGTSPTTKQTVTGSTGGNAALQNLLTALANYGLITDSTT